MTSARAGSIPATTVPRLALSKTEAADALGVSIDFLEQHILRRARIVRLGRRRLIPLTDSNAGSNATVRLATSEIADRVRR